MGSLLSTRRYRDKYSCYALINSIKQTSCSGCALSCTRTLAAWARNYQLARPDSKYPSWSDPGEVPAAQVLRKAGALLCGASKRGRTTLEHVKPKKKGLKNVWIERELRNWCFLRFVGSICYCCPVVDENCRRKITGW